MKSNIHTIVDNLPKLAADLGHAMNKQPGNFCQTFEIADYQRRIKQDQWALNQLEDAEKYLMEELECRTHQQIEQAYNNRRAAHMKIASVKEMLVVRKHKQ